MAQGLLGGVLPAIYSGADQLKRGVYGLLTDPMEQARRAGQSLLQSRADRQVLMGQAFANPDRPFQVTDQNAMAQLGSDVLAGELGFAPAGITAFHGTPHNILGKFDISKVGTGEGAQSYGHGMYFAENPSVAKSYLVNAQSQKTPEGAARSYVRDYPSEKEALIGAKERLQRLQQNGTPDLIQQQEQIIKALESNQLGGNLYKVDIPDEYIPKMLDYDKPLSQQPKAVQDALAKYDPDLYSPKGNDYDSNELGQSIYQRIVQDNVQKFGLGGNSKRASEDLNALGIKGIRYYDEGSRKAGGTSNFVVFDPTDVKILEKNNQPIEGLLD